MFSFFKKRSSSHEVTILYGTHSGNSKYIAKESSKLLASQGVANRLVNLSRFSASQLAEEEKVLIVISTHGEGDAPTSAQKFVESLITAPRLDHLKYSVCALGDSSYEEYCATGRFVDAQLQMLGAQPMVERMDCDVDFTQTAGNWMTQVAEWLGSTQTIQEKVELVKENKTYKAHLVNKQRINSEDSTKEVYHLEFECDLFPYLPGDCVGFLPCKLKNLITSTESTPRYYSIASSPLEVKNGFHLTVKTENGGICSPCLNHLLRPGDELEFIHLASEEFRLHDESQQPIILIASGVGIAPFRAFIRHAAKQVIPRDIWLVYGDRNMETDYLYREEWNDLLNEGKITKMDVAFSRSDSPTYVQDILANNRADVLQWVDKGAAVYVCGSVEMGKSVKSFFNELTVNHPALEYFEELF